MIIPHHLLSPDALRGVIEAFVTREGTDYGAHDVALATKVAQVRQQLDAGTAILVYDEDTDSVTMQPTNEILDHSCPTVIHGKGSGVQAAVRLFRAGFLWVHA